MEKPNKKGQVLQNLGAISIGIIALVIILSVVFVMLAQVKTQSSDLETTSIVSVVNETVTWTNDTYAALSNNGRSILSCGPVLNTSDDKAIPSTLYTCTAARGIIISDSVANEVEGRVNVTYTYSDGDFAYNSTDTLQGATATIPGWVPLIILVMIGGLILGMVRFFGK